MGEVYEAADRERGEHVALKTVVPKLLGSTKVVARFRREIELSRRISHPNVLAIYEVFELPPPSDRPEDRGRWAPCMVMELLHGETLADRLGRDQKIPPDEARPMVCQMAVALGAAHRAEVVHRDLKPDNIFLVDQEDGTILVKVTDFGVARPNNSGKEDAFTATDVIVGTPTYMAPEQLELEDALPVSDIYTLGLVMFEMITGQFPFQGETAIQVVFKRVQEDPPSPREYVPDLEERWEEVILRCLERDPHQRLQHAEMIAEMLKEGGGEESRPWYRSIWPFR